MKWYTDATVFTLILLMAYLAISEQSYATGVAALFLTHVRGWLKGWANLERRHILNQHHRDL